MADDVRARRLGTGARYGDVFAVPDFRVLFATHALMLISETVKMLALSVLVYARTGSPLLSAIAWVAGFLPQVLGGAFLLALTDRLRPRSVLVAVDVLRGASTAVLAVGVLPVSGMLTLVFVIGVAAPLHTAARLGMLPDLFTGDAYVLSTSVLTMTAAGTMVVGFAAGGVLLALAGADGALWVAAGSSVLSASLVRIGLRNHPPRSASREAPVRASLQGNRRLLSDPTVRGLLLVRWLPPALFAGAEAVVVPYVTGIGEASAAGAVFMAMAAGMLVGDVLVGRFLTPRRREQLALPLALLLGIPLLGFALHPGAVLAAALGGTAALGFSYQLGLQRRFLAALPNEVRAQGFGLYSTGLMTAQGLAAAAAGALAELLPPGTVMALAAATAILVVLALSGYLRPDAQL